MKFEVRITEAADNPNRLNNIKKLIPRLFNRKPTFIDKVKPRDLGSSSRIRIDSGSKETEASLESFIKACQKAADDLDIKVAFRSGGRDWDGAVKQFMIVQDYEGDEPPMKWVFK